VVDKAQGNFDLLVYTQGYLLAAKFKTFWRRGEAAVPETASQLTNETEDFAHLSRNS
jgi:hypothetical protein